LYLLRSKEKISIDIARVSSHTNSILILYSFGNDTFTNITTY